MAESKKNTEASKAQINLGSWISRGWDMISADLGSFILLGLIYVAIIGIASSTVIGEFLVIGPLQVGLFIVIFSKMRGNPVNPDLGLWMGAIERLNRAGVKKLAAIHRGFSYFGTTKYRNVPQWEIPIDLHRYIPDLPIFTDPSHIAGRRDLLQEICQEAMDLNFSGLFIESHINPDVALSDKAQQVTPTDLKKLLESLIIRDAEVHDDRVMRDLQRMRKQIDLLDDELMDVLEKRMTIAREIGRHKKANNITIFQDVRWNEIVGKRLTQALEKDLSEEFVDKVFRAIHTESIKKQNKIMNEK